jgi:hypothetical protein
MCRYFCEDMNILKTNPNFMSNDIQNLAQDNMNSNGNLLIEISMTIVFVSIIIFSCIVLFGA